MLMKSTRYGWLTTVLVAGVLAGATAWGQGTRRGVGGDAGFHGSIAGLFGEVAAFSADAEVGLTNRTDQTRLNVPMRVFKSRDRFRLEVDLQRVQGTGNAVQGLSALRGIGMTRMTCLVLPEEKGMILMFPELKLGTRVALSETALPADGFRVEKRAVGKETVEGQACVRQEVQVTTSDGARVPGTVWEAAALKGFPVRMLFLPDGSGLGLRFSQVRMASPGEEMFRVPSDVRIVDGAAGLMQEAMTRALQSGALGR